MTKTLTEATRPEAATGARAASADKAVALADAFVTFEQASQTLATAYGRLEEQFRRVNRELERANHDLTRSLLDTDAMRRFLDRVLASVPCGIVSCDLGGTITTANPALTAMLGRAQGSLLGAHYDAAFGGWGDVTGLLFAREASSGAAVMRERSLARADGSTLAVESILSPLLSGNGEPAGVVEVVKDLSEVRRLEEAVRDARTLAALGEMAAGLAHEIRNPLGGIKGFATLLARDLSDDPEKGRVVAQIVAGVDALNRILTDFLAYGAPGQPEARAFDASGLAAELIALLAAEDAGSRRVSVESRFPRDAALAHADRDQIRQALLNVLKNAFEATPPEGRVVVAVETDARTVSFVVRDSGSGIPEAIRGRLFRPFGSTKQGGTGLGLAVAKTLVERNGGSLAIASSADGAVATIRLPMAIDETASLSHSLESSEEEGA